MTRSLTIVQPYVPSYRVPFFSALSDHLRSTGIELTVVAGLPAGDQALRGDATQVDSHRWLHLQRRRNLHIGTRSLQVSSDRALWKHTHGVILPLQATLPDFHLAAWNKSLAGAPRVGYWGHVAPYVREANVLDVKIEARRMRKADHVFAYTSVGAEAATSAGVEVERVTAVMNSVDTSLLENMTRADLPLAPTPYVAYLGALDASKNVAFLVDVIDWIWRQDPEVKIRIGGDGRDRRLLQGAVDRGQVELLGFLDGAQKAELLASASVLINPGRIGLVAIDALASGTPLVALTDSFDAPEAEYLEDNESIFRCSSEAEAFARRTIDIYRTYDPAVARPGRWSYPHLEDMVANFSTGVRRMLADS